MIRQLKELNYYVAVTTTAKSWSVLVNNPYLDEMIIHERHTMMDHDLPEMKEYLDPMFDHVVDTTFTVENNLLVMAASPMAAPDRQAERRAKLNVNYMDAYVQRFQEGGFNLKPGDIEFYPSRQDKRNAQKLLKKGKGRKCLLWVLTGSSVHKVYPYTGNVIIDFLKRNKDWFVITTGDNVSRVGEEALKDTPRVVRTSDRLDVRTALTLAQMADIVVGPETGLLNCASSSSNPKVVFMSHSTADQLVRYWKNTTTLQTQIAQCFPCHILHNRGFQSCFRDNTTGAALCQATINKDFVLRTIEDAIDERKQQDIPRAMSRHGKGSGSPRIGA